MICYFDSADVNLSHIEQIKNVRPLERLKNRLSNSRFEFIHSTEYKEQGLYVIEVSKHVPHWCGKSTVPNSINLLQEIPNHVIDAVKNKILRIVIIAIIEGDNYVSQNFDGYLSLQTDMINLNLPKDSVVIISGNLNAREQYLKWCKNNRLKPLIEFIEGIEWDGKENNWELPSTPIINSAVSNNFAKSFNSLNRAHRNHRTEHLYYLAMNDLLDDGLVSGGFWFTENNIKLEYKDVLFSNYPRTVDLSIEDLKEPKKIHPSLTSNLKIYTNSLLTVVTESHFDETGGLFITEKTFRPISLGHPFIVLGQPLLMKKLYEMGFKPCFFDSYDTVIENKKRFIEVHNKLLQWKKMPYNEKVSFIEHYLENIQHNFDLYKKFNFKKTMFDSVIESSTKYFLKSL